MIRLTLLLSAAFSLAMAGSLLAADPKVYKWVDENGTVHFSPTPPDGGAEEVKLQRQPGQSADADADSDAPAPATDEPEEEDEDTRHCRAHRDNLQMMENRGRRVVIEDAGAMREMTEQEREAQIQSARENLKICEALGKGK